MFSVVTFNVFGSGQFIDRRIPLIVDAVTEGGMPDVICLQEATFPVLEQLKAALPGYECLTKLQVMKREGYSVQAMEEARNHGFLAIMSRISVKNLSMPYGGSWCDDGILRVEPEGNAPVIYNVHLAGGSFGKPPEILAAKQKLRIQELQILNKAVTRDRLACIVGDFNFDSNGSGTDDPETAFLPEVCIPGCEDLWSSLRAGETGATESTSENDLRRYLKPGQKRESRFDKIIVRGPVMPVSISLAGKVTEEEEWIIPGSYRLCPSDHFGLRGEFSCL